MCQYIANALIIKESCAKISAGYGIVDCIADSAAASIRSRKEQSSHFGGMWCNGSVCHCICGAGKDKCIKCLFIFKPNEWLDTCRNCSGSDSTSHTALLCNQCPDYGKERILEKIFKRDIHKRVPRLLTHIRNYLHSIPSQKQPDILHIHDLGQFQEHL